MSNYYVSGLPPPPLTTQVINYVIVTTEIPVVTVNNSEIVINSVRRAIPVINQPIQALLLIIILISAIVTNSAIILNISRDSLKLRMVHFLLIRHVCITDSVGAIFVLPVPLISFIKGYWDWGDTACAIISTTTACCWTMHLVAVALYRADRVFAVWLPTGRYPVISARIVNGLLVLIWATALTGSYVATLAFTPAFQPALALCIPNVPLVFFILVFACYCIGLVTLTTGYVFAFIRRRRKRKKRKRQPGTSSTRQHPHHQRTLNPAKSAPELSPAPADYRNNNKVILDGGGTAASSSSPTTNMTLTPKQHPPQNKSPRSVNFEDTPSTSTNSCNNMSSSRPLTPPYQKPPPPQFHAHRRTHSDGVHQINTIIASSHESVLSVQYRTLSKRSHDDMSSESYEHCVEESVAEKLDECDGVSGVVSSSNTTSEKERSGGGGERGCGGCDGDDDDYENEHDDDNGQKTVCSERSRSRSRAAKCRIFASYAVSIGHLILYLPAMVTVALVGPYLPPGVAFICGLVVYCEFIVQPAALLLVSPLLAREVIQMVRSFLRVGSSSTPPVCTSLSSSTTTHHHHVNFPQTHQHQQTTLEISSTAACVIVHEQESTNTSNNSPQNNIKNTHVE